jgi:hypothetical protein
MAKYLFLCSPLFFHGSCSICNLAVFDLLLIIHTEVVLLLSIFRNCVSNGSNDLVVSIATDTRPTDKSFVKLRCSFQFYHHIGEGATLAGETSQRALDMAPTTPPNTTFLDDLTKV